MAIFVIFVVFVSENKYDDDNDLSLAAVSDTRGLVLYSEQICLKFGM